MKEFVGITFNSLHREGPDTYFPYTLLRTLKKKRFDFLGGVHNENTHSIF